MPTYDEMHRALCNGTPAERLAAAQWMATCDAQRASVDLTNALTFERDRAVRRAIRAAIVQRSDAYADSRVHDYRSLTDPAEALARALANAQSGTPDERGRFWRR